MSEREKIIARYRLIRAYEEGTEVSVGVRIDEKDNVDGPAMIVTVGDSEFIVPLADLMRAARQ